MQLLLTAFLSSSLLIDCDHQSLQALLKEALRSAGSGDNRITGQAAARKNQEFETRFAVLECAPNIFAGPA